MVSPDNRSRKEINERIHREMQNTGRVSKQEHQLRVLAARQEMTGADRQWAAQYEPGDIVRYTRGSKTLGVEPGEYVHVASVDREQNLLTVERENGQQLTYDPHRLHGVSVYPGSERTFSQGDRVQFTAPYRDEHIANRQLGNRRDRSTRAEICKSGWTPARMCNSTFGSTRISITAMPSPATAAREPPPTACWCTWTPNRATKSWLTTDSLMYRFRAGDTMRKYTQTIEPILPRS